MMPTYCYRYKHSGERVEIVMTQAEKEWRERIGKWAGLDLGCIFHGKKRAVVLLGQKEAVLERDWSAEHGDFRDTPGNYPMESVADGVNPKQREKATKASIKAGCETHFTERGDAIFTSNEHRNRYHRIMGRIDRDASYGQR